MTTGISARFVTWWTILRICLEERLVYRGDFALGTLMRFMPIVTQIFLWGAIFVHMSGSTIAGWSYNEFIAYYLLTMVARAFSSMPGLASGMAREIREGTIKKFLVQPIDMIGFLLLSRLAHKLVYYGVAIGPFALVFFLCRDYFPAAPDGMTIAAFVASLLMGFLLGFFLEATIGLIGFWFLEVSSLLFVYMLFSFFFSGHMFPLDMLPPPWSYVVDALPLKYLAYFPAAVWLGKIQGPDLVNGLLVEAAWVAFFMLASRVAFHRGVRRYSAFRRLRGTIQISIFSSIFQIHIMQPRPSYWNVFRTFARNSLVRDMTFRSNFIIELISSLSWLFMNLGFYLIIFHYADSIGVGTGWGKYEFLIFFGTTALINSLVQAFFMPNAEEFSELIRTGNLDFALLKPIDTQFLVSLNRVNWSSLGNAAFAICLMSFCLRQLETGGNGFAVQAIGLLLYPIYVVCGALILYSLMIALASTSIWLGRNQSLYNFWFYITNFSRYPMEIYDGPEGAPRRWVGQSLRGFFSFVIPVLVAVNVPARLLAKPLEKEYWPLAAFALLATVASLLASRWVFYRALGSYRSASS